ncbi:MULTISPECIES: response regulator [Pseudovibrio]|uniref:response regulator n=1 Tax=Stappiaceae TaxID=2821832 RepID=UPI002366772D|nr:MULTISPECIES: response regulator [Pseudovibrio]MDD7908971.1 response regulator [Pseudovibrio exalbescens]MDX5593708.1 response regulator [Pseudovibrio sp. SPO723]
MRHKKAALSNYSVLIAEGNNYMRSLLRTMVAGFGVRNIYEAQDGADAIAIAIDRRPDIILCEWVMRPLDGEDFLRILREDSDPDIAQTPVIVISADARRSVVIQAMRAGVNLFLSKPLSPAVLQDRMIAIMEGHYIRKKPNLKESAIRSNLNQHLQKLEEERQKNLDPASPDHPLKAVAEEMKSKSDKGVHERLVKAPQEKVPFRRGK